MSRVVIVGQGYVGLPLAMEAAESGHQVVGMDLDESRVRALNAGHSMVDDIADATVARAIGNGYRATTDPGVYADADVIVICVPTPLGKGKQPDLGAVIGVVDALAPRIASGTLVVLESTTYPGTTTSVLVPRLENAGFIVGRDVFVAFSPERIDPGNAIYGLRNTPKVVGADDPVSRRLAEEFYATIVDQVVPVKGSAEAELTKLLENTYRHVNIALVNEIAMFCRELDIDVWEVIRAASTKPFGFQAFFPGPGVGGHCIPIDPNYLSYRVRESLERPFRFVELAEEINSSMPGYVAARIQEMLNGARKAVNGSRVLLLGVTYKPGISDTRESPATPLARQLIAKGADVTFHDPFVSSWTVGGEVALLRVENLQHAVEASDVTVLLQAHPSYDADALAERAELFLDTRGVTTSELARRL